MYIIRPSKEEVENFVGIDTISLKIPTPSNNKEEWNKSHRDFVLKVLLPQIKPPIKTWRIVAEAYLTDIFLEKENKLSTFEQILSDGSSLVPNWAYKWGNIKDPWGVGHDLIYVLHKLNLRDVYGKKWSLIEAHNMYRDGWLASKEYIIGWTWWIGLILGGWVFWYNKSFKTPEKITKIINKSEFNYELNQYESN